MPPGAIVVTLLGLAVNLDVEGGAVIEGRRGSAPIGTADPPHAASVAVLTPGAGFLLSSPNGYLRSRYFPALTAAYIDGVSGRRLYVLHQADLSALLITDRRVSWTLRLAGATGDTDYTALAQLLGRTQRQLPSVTGFTVGTAVLTSTVELDRRTQLETSLDFLHRAALGQSRSRTDLAQGFPAFSAFSAFSDCPPPAPLPARPPPAPAIREPREPPAPGAPPPPRPEGALAPPDPNPTTSFFPTQDQLTLTPGVIRAATRQDTVDLRAGFGSLWLSTGLQMLRVAPHLGWRHSFGRESSIKIGLGLVYTQLVSRPPRGCDLTQDALPHTTLNPVADVAVSSVLVQRRGLLLAASFAAAALWYFDPVIARAGSVGTGTFQLAAILPPDWSIRLDASFSTSLGARPIPGEPDETVFMATLPARYWASRDVYFELGGRWSERAPHLKAQNFHLHRRELWIYAAVGGTFGTARSSPATGNPASTSGRPTRGEVVGAVTAVSEGGEVGGPAEIDVANPTGGVRPARFTDD